jgi:hypothetical protein
MKPSKKTEKDPVADNSRQELVPMRRRSLSAASNLDWCMTAVIVKNSDGRTACSRDGCVWTTVMSSAERAVEYHKFAGIVV